MPPQVVVLNGTSSAGKTGIARCLQAIRPEPWLRLGIDDLIGALPPSLRESDGGIVIGAGGDVTVGDAFREVEAAWLAGLAAMARAGARVIVDDVFLGGAASQGRVRAHLAGLAVLWVGVRCDTAIVTGRELARGDRVIGLAAAQAPVVHEGVAYDLEVDSGAAEALDCARAIAARLG